MTPARLAEACAQAMWARDAASPALGMALDHVEPGAARVSMTVAPHMLNGHGTCHGGLIFALADTAFAFACNTGGMASVASHCSISFLHPVPPDAHLIAHAEERHQEGRTGIYDVRVTMGGTTVAEFRGLSRTTGQPLPYPPLPDAT